MHSVSINPWAAKCRALDRYRWRLLRQHHGLPGSCLRVLRAALVDFAFGVRARWRLASASDGQSCDFLLLQAAPKVIRLQRKKMLIEGVRARGFSLVETALPEPGEILRQRQLRKPPYPVPIRYFGMAAYAEWLAEHYRPRILLNDRNGSLYVPFLRLALNARGALLVHLAHATTVEGSRRLGMNDYDYYFLFGQSSIEALRQRPLRFGHLHAVLSGSHMVDLAYDMPPAEPAARTLLVLGVGPDKEKERGYLATYALLKEWASGHPDYRVLIKAHPRSQATFWQQAAAELPNLQVLPSGCSLAEALRQASVVVNIMSNAVIEAALAHRPVIYVNVAGTQDIFEQERFLGARVSDLHALSERVAAIAGNYSAYVERSVAFAEHHLSHGCKGLSNTLDLLQQLLAGMRPESILLPASPPDLGGPYRDGAVGPLLS